MSILQWFLSQLGIANVSEQNSQKENQIYLQDQITALAQKQYFTEERVSALEMAFNKEISNLHHRHTELSGNFKNHKAKTEDELKSLRDQVESLILVVESMQRIASAEVLRPQIIRLSRALKTKRAKLNKRIEMLAAAANDEQVENSLKTAVNDD